MERIPFIDLGPWVEKVRGRVPESGFSRFEIDVGGLVDSNEFLGGGPTTQKLEAKLEAKLGAKHVVTCANGTDALQLALRACGIDRGHRVAIPNLTFWATYEAVVNVGATPVLLDIDPSDRQMSFEEFEHAHAAGRFDAAILVHLYGWCSSRLADFRTFCRDKRITLIEDGAQAFGVEVDDSTSNTPRYRSVFTDADVATLSFHPAKVLGGIGDGGAVVTRNPRTAARVRALANHGRADGGQHEHIAVGWNSRLDALQAAWLLRALDVIDEVIEERRRLRARYTDLLVDAAGKRGTRLAQPASVQPNGYMNTIASNVHPAAAVVPKLIAQGIEARNIYPHTIADQATSAVQYGPLLRSRAVAYHIVSLPLWYGMTDEMVERCVKAFAEAVR